MSDPIWLSVLDEQRELETQVLRRLRTVHIVPKPAKSLGGYDRTKVSRSDLEPLSPSQIGQVCTALK